MVEILLSNKQSKLRPKPTYRLFVAGTSINIASEAINCYTFWQLKAKSS